MSTPTLIQSKSTPPIILFFILPIVFYVILSLIILKMDPYCREREPDKRMCATTLYLPVMTIFLTSCFSYVMFMLYLGKEWYVFILPLFVAIIFILLIHYTFIAPQYFN